MAAAKGAMAMVPPGCGACCIARRFRRSPNRLVCRAAPDDEWRCRIFGQPERPACCSGLQPSPEMCGLSREHALKWLSELEVLTHPG
jgi:hypothetical protein